MIKRRWDIIHKSEEREKASFLKGLTAQTSLGIFMDLYSVFDKVKDKNEFRVLNLKKVNSLSKIHRIFNNLSI